MCQGYINTVAGVVVQLSRNTAKKLEFSIQEHEDLVTLIEEIVNGKLFLCSKVSQSETYLEPCHTSTMECLTKSKLVYFFLKKFNQKYLTRSTAHKFVLFLLHQSPVYRMFQNLFIINETSVFKFYYCISKLKVNKSSSLRDINSFLGAALRCI